MFLYTNNKNNNNNNNNNNKNLKNKNSKNKTKNKKKKKKKKKTTLLSATTSLLTLSCFETRRGRLSRSEVDKNIECGSCFVQDLPQCIFNSQCIFNCAP